MLRRRARSDARRRAAAAATATVPAAGVATDEFERALQARADPIELLPVVERDHTVVRRDLAQVDVVEHVAEIDLDPGRDRATRRQQHVAVDRALEPALIGDEERPLLVHAPISPGAGDLVRRRLK